MRRATPTAITSGVLVCLFSLLGNVQPSWAILYEDIAISSKAVSLANAVTAYPPGHMSVHYNPAGLSTMHDGALISLGTMSGGLSIDASFSADPDFHGFLGKISDKSGKNAYDFDNKADPVNGTSSEISGLRMYIPAFGEMDMSGGVELPTPFGFALQAVPGVPLGASYRKPGSRWTFGFGVYAPGVGGYYREDDDPGRYLGKAATLQHIVYAAPSLSYQVTDSLSVGFTIGLGQNILITDMDMRLPNDLVAITKLLGEATKGLYVPVVSDLTLPSPWFGGGLSPFDTVANTKIKARDDYCPNYNLGILWQPTNWFALGACYQSEVEVNPGGTYKFTYTRDFQRMVNWMGSSPLLELVSTIFDLPMKGVPSQSGHFYLDGFDLPQRAHVGIMLRPFKRLRLTCDAHWVDYDIQEAWTIEFDQEIQPLKIAKFVGHTEGPSTLSLDMNMESEIHFSYGIEYQLFDWLCLRAGYEDRQTSLNRDYLSLLAPVPDVDFYGAGLGINFKSGMTLDLAYAYLTSGNVSVPNNTSKLMNSTSLTDAIYNPYAGQDVDM